MKLDLALEDPLRGLDGLCWLLRPLCILPAGGPVAENACVVVAAVEFDVAVAVAAGVVPVKVAAAIVAAAHIAVRLAVPFSESVLVPAPGPAAHPAPLAFLLGAFVAARALVPFHFHFRGRLALAATVCACKNHCVPAALFHCACPHCALSQDIHPFAMSLSAFAAAGVSAERKHSFQ